jgi:hypothetical protein
MDDQALMGIRADTLFTYDGRGRMVASNEPDSRPAPRLFVGRTAGGHVARFGQAVPDEVAREVEAIVGRQPAGAGLAVPPDLRAALREVLERHGPIGEEGGGPTYRFPASLAQPGGAVKVTDTNVEVVREAHPWLFRELPLWGPCFAVLRDGAAVSICFSSRIGAHACEAGLFTLPEHRGRGYAVAVTAAWGAAVRASGRAPLYSTGWENLASQAVARKVGLTMFGADASWK